MVKDFKDKIVHMHTNISKMSESNTLKELIRFGISLVVIRCSVMAVHSLPLTGPLGLTLIWVKWSDVGATSFYDFCFEFSYQITSMTGRALSSTIIITMWRRC